MGLTSWRFSARPRQHPILDAALLRRVFVGWGGELAIAGNQGGWASELLNVGFQARKNLRSVVRMASEERGLGADAALDLAQPEHAAELHRLAGRARADDRGVRLEPADQLLRSRYLLVVEYLPARLLNDLLDPWHEGRNGFGQALGQAVRLLRNLGVELLLHLLGRLNHLLGQVE